MGQFLLVEVGCMRCIELGEMELLARAGLRVIVLRRWWREVQVAGFIEGEPAAFPELEGLLVMTLEWVRTEGWAYQGVGELDIQVAYLHRRRSISICCSIRSGVGRHAGCSRRGGRFSRRWACSGGHGR